jgi:hypothetical protein
VSRPGNIEFQLVVFIYIPSLLVLYYCFFCLGFVVLCFYALCSGLIVATDTCSCAHIEDVHYHFTVKKRGHI